MFELFTYVYSCNALSARFFAVDRALNSYFMIMTNCSCKGVKAVCLIFLPSNRQYVSCDCHENKYSVKFLSSSSK